MKDRKKLSLIIILLSAMIVILSALLVYFIHIANSSDDFDGLENSYKQVQEQLSSYQNEISEKNSQIEFFSSSLDEQKSVYESEKSELNKKIDDLNGKIKKYQSTSETVNYGSAVSDMKPAADSKTVYLTFDDGPSPNTLKIIDVLNSYNIKATFFVKNNPQYNSYMKNIVNSGNAIALHTYSHDYKTIYTSDEAFYNDLQNISDLVFFETGVRSNIMRFPGGSSNTVSKKYNTETGIMTRLTQGVTEKGYLYFDWNCSSGDASSNSLPKDDIVANCKKVPSAKNVIVLMHDTGAKQTTVEALPEIIEFYNSCGYAFDIITQSTVPVHHKVNN